MRIFFEKYEYKTDQIQKILGEHLVSAGTTKGRWKTDRIGYHFVNTDEYSGPVFILPKSFLIEESGRLNVLGMNGVYPEDVMDTDDPANKLELEGKGSFLPELGLWLFRALYRFREEHEGSPISQRAMLDSQLPDRDSKDKDFLSTALDLMDFLKEHRNLFTQVSIINHSGRDRIDWPKTVSGESFIIDGEPWYFQPAIRKKTIDIDDTLLVLYYSVLKYLRDKFRFPIDLGDVPYELLSTTEVQRLIDTGIGSKQLRRIRHKYFRDDFKHLWRLLDSFFASNASNEECNRTNEHLLVRKFEAVFEAMIDSLLSDTRGVEDLKKQDDGKLVDHIFRYTSLIGSISDIYFIGDSKYYRDDLQPEGIALYKQFTYAKNAIQYHIDKYYLDNDRGPWSPKGKGEIRYRDTITEGYNITPNFFIRARVTKDDIDFSEPSLKKTIWDESKRLENPPSNKHFKDRLFDRDTLILREFSINLLFAIASYAGYESECWSSSLHRTIRDTFIESIDKDYEFFKLTPITETPLSFSNLYMPELVGKTYTIDEADDYMLVAFERNEQGQKDKEEFKHKHFLRIDTGEKVAYDLSPTSLRDLTKQ